MDYILAFLAILTPVVFIHELGHYWVARQSGVVVEVFSVGFGPELFSRVDRHGTRWRIAALPLGGYVKMRGDENAASMPTAGASVVTGSFAAASVWARMAIVAAEPGSASNRFDETTEQLVLKIDAGASGLVQVTFSVESQSPQVIVRALPESVTALDESAEDFATFDAATGQLLIPGLEIGGQIVYRNLVFLLTDAVNLLFSLQSLEEG